MLLLLMVMVRMLLVPLPAAVGDDAGWWTHTHTHTAMILAVFTWSVRWQESLSHISLFPLCLLSGSRSRVISSTLCSDPISWRVDPPFSAAPFAAEATHILIATL